MHDRPAIPLLVLVPGESEIDLDAIFAVAGAYARAGLLVSGHGHRRDEPVFAFPAVVCAGFAVELYFKFFLMLGNVEGLEGNAVQAKGHPLPQLWRKLRPEYQVLIAGMHRNTSSEPFLAAIEARTEIFLKSLAEIGDSPFTRWRYVHELKEVGQMSHAAIQDVLNALEGAANYVMRKRKVELGDNVSLGVKSSIVDGLAGSPSQQERKVDPLGAAAKDLGRGMPLLLGRESPIRRIPSNLRRSTAFYLDELRQAAESMDVAYSRLHHDLTSLALQAPAPEDIPVVSAYAFFDAWGFVAAVNNFYQAYVGFPGMMLAKAGSDHQSFASATFFVRKLHQFMCDFKARENAISPGDMPVLGEITWMTSVQEAPRRVVWHCTLRPGSMVAPPVEKAEPVTGSMSWPTDSIVLSLAGVKADFSIVRLHVAARLWDLEKQIFRAFNAPEQEGVAVFNDFFSRRPVSPLSSSEDA